MKIIASVDADEVLVAIKRPEGYEDVHPQLVAEDALPGTTFEYRLVWPVEVAPCAETKQKEAR